jgi:NTP pyrophosphatase (non-canonical NTP hydrolase)
MGKSLQDLTDEIREINISKGWRPAEGGPGDNTFGDYLALLHSEVSEALEAYRDHRLADATTTTVHATPPHGRPKPQGVGSELADVLIRLLDMCDVFGIAAFDMDCEIADVAALDAPEWVRSFGDHLAWLHFRASELVFAQPDSGRTEWKAASLLRVVVTVARFYGINMTAEVERKIAYNRTREFQHGGRSL